MHNEGNFMFISVFMFSLHVKYQSSVGILSFFNYLISHFWPISLKWYMILKYLIDWCLLGYVKGTGYLLTDGVLLFVR